MWLYPTLHFLKAYESKKHKAKNTNMNTDNFQWTDELVAEYSLASQGMTLFEFKRSKSESMKEYEILSFDAGICVLGKNEDGTFGMPGWGTTENDLLSSSVHKIHSVRRLSDNTVWTVGDKCIVIGTQYEIVSFETLPDNLNIMVWVRNPIYHSFSFRIESLQKPKRSLLTTTDGVPISDLKEFWEIEPQTWEVRKTQFLHYNLYFSTKEAADQYVLENKPCLSLHDVLSMSTHYSTSGSLNEIRYFGFKTIMDFVKKKINGQK